MISKEDVLEYHRKGRPGKIEVVTTKPCFTQKDLTLAYTPGVAEPCREIHKNKADSYNYTARGNLVAVVSNGTRVLGLGDIGAAASKPVMEGKGVLFKRFGDIDVFDLEVDSPDPEDVIKVVRLLEPTFGGINLEDIRSPDCFYVEEELKKQMSIPVFHDDQHGTAIISGAGLINAVELVGKRIDRVRVVISGAGAAGLACARFYLELGVRRENLILHDIYGVVYKGRKEEMNPWKEPFAVDTPHRTLSEIMKGADVFLGVSAANIVTQDMVRSMADRPIIFALANPEPEIRPEEALAARDDVIIATGRSDYPNQINNLMGFPYIFRGALDVRSKAINEEMKLAAARAIALLAKEPVPFTVLKAYRLDRLQFGRDYFIPKPFDPRLLIWVASAVAKAAMDTGVAQLAIDIHQYKEKLESRLGTGRKVMRVMINKAKQQPKKIVYPEGEHIPVLKGCEIVLDEGIAHPILLGNRDSIERKIDQMHLNLKGVEIIDPVLSEKYEKYAETFLNLKQRRGITKQEAWEKMLDRNHFGAMMVHMGDADGFVSGLTQSYPKTVRPALQIIGMKPGIRRAAGLILLAFKDCIYFCADTTINIEPSAEDLAEVALLCAKEVRRFNIEPRIAMLSFSNFGSAVHPLTSKIRAASEIARNKDPNLIIDGEMQADTAVVPELLDEFYPFSKLSGKGGANVLIFPSLESANIAFKLLNRLGGAEAIGPILMGMEKPVQVLQIGDFNEMDVVNMTAIAVVEAQRDLGLKFAAD